MSTLALAAQTGADLDLDRQQAAESEQMAALATAHFARSSEAGAQQPAV